MIFHQVIVEFNEHHVYQFRLDWIYENELVFGKLITLERELLHLNRNLKPKHELLRFLKRNKSNWNYEYIQGIRCLTMKMPYRLINSWFPTIELVINDPINEHLRTEITRIIKDQFFFATEIQINVQNQIMCITGVAGQFIIHQKYACDSNDQQFLFKKMKHNQVIRFELIS